LIFAQDTDRWRLYFPSEGRHAKDFSPEKSDGFGVENYDIHGPVTQSE
jgi:hypothetical protein